ncbi:MAG: hypothetical protein BWZ10_03504 [candidate division BRC1 bacterium ADurb.BinA364]|nr:MAG: hypothetical protein BWZ10_03504 [candidate division BRC1 bacterium ADurb.BinA364]
MRLGLRHGLKIPVEAHMLEEHRFSVARKHVRINALHVERRGPVAAFLARLLVRFRIDERDDSARQLLAGFRIERV